jgi:hypothetical protein
MFMQTILWADSRLSAFIILSLPRVHLHSPLAAFTCGDAGGGELAATSLVCYLNIHGFIIHHRCCARRNHILCLRQLSNTKTIK